MNADEVIAEGLKLNPKPYVLDPSSRSKKKASQIGTRRVPSRGPSEKRRTDGGPKVLSWTSAFKRLAEYRRKRAARKAMGARGVKTNKGHGR